MYIFVYWIWMRKCRTNQTSMNECDEQNDRKNGKVRGESKSSNAKMPCLFHKFQRLLYSLVRINVIYHKMIATQLAYWTQSTIFTLSDRMYVPNTHSQCCSFFLSSLHPWCVCDCVWCGDVFRPMNITEFVLFNFLCHSTPVSFFFLFFSPLFSVCLFACLVLGSISSVRWCKAIWKVYALPNIQTNLTFIDVFSHHLLWTYDSNRMQEQSYEKWCPELRVFPAKNWIQW